MGITYSKMKIVLFFLCFLQIVGFLLANSLRPEEQWRPGEGRDISKYDPRILHVNALHPKETPEKLVKRQKRSSFKKKNGDCGMEGSSIRGEKEPLIIGGNEAVDGQFPWAASLVIDGSLYCGGSLISAGHVLTAAHCLDGAWYVDINLGTSKFGAGPYSIQITSFNYVIHPDWNPITLSNDIAIIYLPSNVEFTDFISPICLPEIGDTVTDGDLVTIVGWGKESDIGSISSSLNYKEAPVISDNVCGAVYGDLSDGVGCVDGPTTCNGDSGGSVMSRIEMHDGYKWSQAGVLSFGSSLGCETGFPNGFTRVEYYLQWIRAETGLEN